MQRIAGVDDAVVATRDGRRAGGREDDRHGEDSELAEALEVPWLEIGADERLRREIETVERMAMLRRRLSRRSTALFRVPSAHLVRAPFASATQYPPQSGDGHRRGSTRTVYTAVPDRRLARRRAGDDADRDDREE